MPQRFMGLLSKWFTSLLLTGSQKDKLVERVMEPVFVSSDLATQGNDFLILVQTCAVFTQQDKKRYHPKYLDLVARINEFLIRERREDLVLFLFYMVVKGSSLGQEQVFVIDECCTDLFERVGKNSERSMQFALVLLSYHAQTLTDRSLTLPTGYRGFMFQTAHYVVAAAANRVPRQELPIKRWLLTLLDETIRRENDEIDRVIWYIIRMFASVFDQGRINITDRAPTQQELAAMQAPLLVDDLNNENRFWVTVKQKSAVNRIVQKFQRQPEALAQTRSTLAWFSDHEQALTHRTTTLWQDVVKNPRRCLHTQGDLIRISLSPLFVMLGISEVTLIPQGGGFSRVRVIVRRTHYSGVHWLDFEGYLLNGTLNIQDELFANAWQVAPIVLGRMLHMVLVHSLYQLVAEPAEPSAKSTTSSRREGLYVGREVAVVPHVRTLQPGQQASQTAKEAARASLGIELPRGVTFVQGHMRAGVIVPQESSQFPRAGRHAYDDTLFRSLLE